MHIHSETGRVPKRKSHLHTLCHPPAPAALRRLAHVDGQVHQAVGVALHNRQAWAKAASAGQLQQAQLAQPPRPPPYSNRTADQPEQPMGSKAKQGKALTISLSY